MFYPIGCCPGALFNECVDTILLLQESLVCAHTLVWKSIRLLLTVNGHSLLPIRLLLVGCSGHRCGCSIKYTCARCWWVLLATSWAAPCWVLRSLVQLFRKLGCTHTTTSVGAATKRQVAKEMALHVQYLLKSILCNSCEQIQQLMTLGSSNPFSFILELLPRASSQLSNHQGGHQGHQTLDDQWDARCEDHLGSLSRASLIWSPAGRMPASPKQFQDRAFPSTT